MESVKAALEHIRQIHFVSLLLCLTIGYISYSSAIESPRIYTELDSLQSIYGMIKTPPKTSTSLETINRPWLDEARSGVARSLRSLVGSVELSSQALDDLFGYEGPGFLVQMSKQDSIETMRNVLGNTILSVKVPVIGSKIFDEKTKSPIDKQALAKVGGTFKVMNVDTSKRVINFNAVQYHVTPCPVPGRAGDNMPCFAEITVGSFHILFSFESASITMNPIFDERFPQLKAHWSQIAPKTIDGVKRHLDDNRMEAWGAKKAKFFEIEMIGTDIALFGASAIVLTLWYLVAHLDTVNGVVGDARIRSAPPEDVPAAYALWVGVQENWTSQILFIASLLACPGTVYLSYGSIAPNKWIGWVLVGLSAVFAFRAYMLTLVIRRALRK